MALTKRIGIIQAEIANNPLARDYTGSPEVVAGIFNALDRQRNLDTITGSEVARHIDDAEWTALPVAKRQQVLALLGVDNLDPFGFAVSVLKDAFPAGGVTLQSLGTARTETISRGIELGLSHVFASDIEDARNN